MDLKNALVDILHVGNKWSNSSSLGALPQVTTCKGCSIYMTSDHKKRWFMNYCDHGWWSKDHAHEKIWQFCCIMKLVHKAGDAQFDKENDNVKCMIAHFRILSLIAGLHPSSSMPLQMGS